MVCLKIGGLVRVHKEKDRRANIERVGERRRRIFMHEKKVGKGKEGGHFKLSEKKETTLNSLGEKMNGGKKVHLWN